MNKVPCTFKEVRNVNGIHVGYRCSFDLVLVEAVSDSTVPVQPYVFTSVGEALDNALLARECGLSVSCKNISIVVTPTHFSNLYNAIREYVSFPDNDKEC